MKKSFKMGISLILATTMVFGLVGCGDEPTAAPTQAAQKTEEPTAAPTEEAPVSPYTVLKDKDGNVYDLGGVSITWVDWWSDAEGKVAEAKTLQEEATNEYHEWLQETYNFSFKRAGKNGWGDNPDNFNLLATNGPEDPNELELYTVDDRNLYSGLKNGLFYDLATLDCLDFSEEKWETGVMGLMTQGSSIYGMRAELPEPKGGLWFNKKLLQEAGIDPETIYDMQANGTWTWDAFEALCQQCMIDVDGDGITDKYAMCSFSCDYFPTVLASNGAQPIKIVDGQYVMDMTNDAYVEALQWGMDMLAKYEMPAPEDANWDYGRTSFPAGLCAFNVAEEYNAGNFAANMEDDYGFVMFPYGPKLTKCQSYANDNVYVIASSYTADQAWKIAFAYNVWTETTPGYEGQDTWKNGYYQNFRDLRAVDETLAMMATSVQPKLTRLVSGWDDGPALFYAAYGHGSSAIELIESAITTLQPCVDAANGITE